MRTTKRNRERKNKRQIKRKRTRGPAEGTQQRKHNGSNTGHLKKTQRKRTVVRINATKATRRSVFVRKSTQEKFKENGRVKVLVTAWRSAPARERIGELVQKAQKMHVEMLR